MITTIIDLASLPSPDIVETIDFETIYADRKAALIALYPLNKQAEIAATLEFESEPLAINLQENAFREMVLRQRVNDAARAVMLAYARGADLDQLAALLGVERLVITAADPENDIALVMESDTDLRKRAQLAPEGFSVAGPEGGYISSTLNADARVLDAAAKSPSPGAILVTVLSREDDGIASESLITSVSAALNAERARPMTDQVTVQSAELVDYQVVATIFTFPGPDPGVAVMEARKGLDAYIEKCHRINSEVVISGLHASMHVAGIQRVVLTSPIEDVQANDTQAPNCTSILVVHGGTYVG